MNITDFLIKVVEKTDGWVIVAIFAMYVGFHCYKKYKDGEALSKSLSILDSTITSLLRNIEQSINTLTSRIIDSLASRR